MTLGGVRSRWEGMLHLRRAVVVASVLVAAALGLSASPAMAADPLAACDPALAPGLTWSAPSFVAWGRQARIGADVADPGDGPGYQDDSVALAVDAGSASAAATPVDHDLEFVVTAPARGSALHGSATWTLVDQAGVAICAQSAAPSVSLGAGKTLRFAPKARKNGIAWAASNPGDCHDIALQSVSLTVQQGAVTRRLSAADQCDPAGSPRVATRDWELELKNGAFELHALSPHSSLKTRLRYALRVGSRRVASGSLSLVRTYRPVKRILWSNMHFLDLCVHGLYKPYAFGNTLACDIPGAFSLHLKLA
jgi:hypothetical protein